jgi:cytochrome c oxidase cbb3-type subunit 3
MSSPSDHSVVRLGVGLLLAGAVLASAACEREERRFTEMPPGATPTAMVTVGGLQPGPAIVADTTYEGPYGDNAWATNQGALLFNQMNCVGCHSHGGGGMGPPLMDDKWIYGSAPQQVFATIAEGRPNGMPAWKYSLGDQQIWQLVAYVRSMSGLTPKGARPGRSDHMMVRTPSQQTPNAKPKESAIPKSAEMP